MAHVNSPAPYSNILRLINIRSRAGGSVRNIKFPGATYSTVLYRYTARRNGTSVTSASLSGSRSTTTGGDGGKKKEAGEKEEKHGRGRLMLSNFGRNRALDTYRGEHYGDARGRALEAAPGCFFPPTLPSACIYAGGIKNFARAAPPMPPARYRVLRTSANT